MVRPARSSSGGVSSTPTIRPLAIDGAAPSTMTNRIAAGVLTPNKMIANGNQAIDGMVCNAVIIEPTAARSGLTRDTSAPTTSPMTRARPDPIAARLMVVAMACHSRA